MFGTWVNTPSPDLVETLGDVGFDCVFLDLEHGEYGTEALPDLLRAARATGCFGVVRTSHVSAREVGAALDAGADGVLAPGVSSAAEAATVVSAAHYPPVGSRGAAPMTRAARYGTTPFTSYRERSEAEVVAGAQIEGPAGLAAVDDILATAHLDLAFIGPFDLSQHLGVPGDTSHPVRRRGDGRHRRPRRRQGRRHGDLGTVGRRRPPVGRRRHPPRDGGQHDGPVHDRGDRVDRRVALVAVTQVPD